jgi:hypothetical protein
MACQAAGGVAILAGVEGTSILRQDFSFVSRKM